MSNTRNEKGYIATEPTQDGMIGWRHWLSARWLDGTTDSARDDWMASLTQREMIGWHHWLSVRWLDGTTDSAWDDWMASLTQHEMIGWHHWLSVRWLDGVTDSAWDDWMASLTQQARGWTDSRRWYRAGKRCVLQSRGGHKEYDVT